MVAIMRTNYVCLIYGCLLLFCPLILLPRSAQGERLVGMLYPRDSESRDVRSLDGMWNFRVDLSTNRNASFEQRWYRAPLSKTGEVISMPVPSSYNDITQNKSIRDFVGWAWYDKEFFVPKSWKDQRTVLRFDSAHYFSIVWVNSREVMRHDGGHLPFEADVSLALNFGAANRVTAAINNKLTPHTLPCGSIEYKTDSHRYPPGYFVQNVQFDFFNYAGIHRSVKLYTTPQMFIDDINITTGIAGNNGIVNFTIIGGGPPGFVIVTVEILDKDGAVAAKSSSLSDSLVIHNAKFWWPYTMNAASYGYLYTLKATLATDVGADVYRQPFGIRTVQVTSTQLLINNQPFYCHGAAKHEDSDIRGKGLDFPLIAKDFNLLKWLGANCFRTSHYPYAEEIMDQADQQGIVVIDESPAVGLNSDENLSNKTLLHHLEVMRELVRRDKNRPAVIMWSVANEPRTQKKVAQPYFKSVIQETRNLDPTRPVTFVSNQSPSTDLAVQYVDVICFNRYSGWYSDCSHTELIQLQMDYDFQEWYDKFHKPLMITEYGADTVAGLHQDPSFVFTEEFQVEFMSEYHKVFDKFRRKFLVGEMVWNFADFMTVQEITRVVGNKKGVFTRQRQPKMSAHLLRARYLKLINSTLHGH